MKYAVYQDNMRVAEFAYLSDAKCFCKAVRENSRIKYSIREIITDKLVEF